MPLLAMLDDWSLKRLASAAIIGAVFGALLLVTGDSLQLPTWALLLVLAACALSWLMYHLGKRSVLRGLSKNRWSDAERRATGLALRAGARALLPVHLLIAAVCFVERFVKHRREMMLVWLPMYLLSISMTAMRREIAPPAPDKQGGSWPDVKPLQSEHWGERYS